MILKDGKKTPLPKNFSDGITKPIVFELHSSQGGYNAATHKTQFPGSRGILPFYTIREKVDQSKGAATIMVEYRYATSQTPDPNMKGEYLYNPPEIAFIKGQLICDPAKKEHLDLIYILRNHPKNANNSDGTPIFYEVDPEKNANERINKTMARHESEEKILKEWNEDQLREVAFSFGDILAGEKSKKLLQDYLLTKMESDPVGFFKKATAEDLILRANISEALALKVLVFNEAEKIWFWGVDKDREDKSGNEICRLRADEDPKTRLMIFFNHSVKSENLDYFLDKLKDAREAKSGKKVEA